MYVDIYLRAPSIRPTKEEWTVLIPNQGKITYE